LPVPLVYLDEKRSFGGALDDADTRLVVYRAVLEKAQGSGRREQGSGVRDQISRRCSLKCGSLPPVPGSPDP
jgi:hypothetical protein